MIRLGVNIDHVATLRNARGTDFPDPARAAQIALEHGADGIVAHLREDRRHIRDADMPRLREVAPFLNMEMANTEEMVAIALDVGPDVVTLVPEKREELTTEGGLDIVALESAITQSARRLHEKNIEVSLFIEPDAGQIEASARTGANIVEFHTGRYCELFEAHGPRAEATQKELKRLIDAGALAADRQLKVAAGHGLNFGNVSPVLAMPALEELNIGHSLVCEAVFSGLGNAVSRMKNQINA